MTLVIFDGNTKNYTVLNKNDNDLKIELIKVQTDDNNELPAPKQTMPKTSRKSKKLTKKNKEFLNSLTKDSNSNKTTNKDKVKLTKENQDFLDALKT
jgi:uncharacterized membrane-anchored protein